jgi:hypothetical protein
MQTSAAYRCAYCGESVEIEVDPSAENKQEYVEDCWVCCRPNVLTVVFDRDGDVTVTASPES